MHTDGQDKAAGTGHIALDLHGNQAVFSSLSYCYPLKILSPRIHEPVAIAYVLTYGGGLVSGDRIRLRVDVASGASLLLLTQGSTKVFKHRPGVRLAKSTSANDDAFGLSTVQRLDVRVQEGGLLLLLPDPVTCFSDAAYNQIQTFKLEKGSSIALLDWVTAGRMSRGEEWDFATYHSINEIWLSDKRIARDALLLERDQSEQRSVKDRMAPYYCYASLFLCGPKTDSVVEALLQSYHNISVYQLSSPPNMLWSMSRFAGGCVVRVAAKETETVKHWLRDHLHGFAKHVGSDVLNKSLI